MFLAVLEDDVAVVDEDDGRRVLLRPFEDLMDALVEVPRPADERPVDQEELATQAVGECPADGGFSGSGWARDQDTALGFDLELVREHVVLERQDDVRLERSHDVVDATQ